MITQKKEPTQKRKFKNFIAKCLVFNPLERGHKVWKNLNKVLPEAVGSTTDDEPRLNDFKELIKKISFLDYYALKKWLEFIYNDTEELSFGLHTGKEEAYCSKWMQIYSQHYDAME